MFTCESGRGTRQLQRISRVRGETDTYQAVLRYVEDELYGDRFQNFIEKNLLVCRHLSTTYISQKSYTAIMKKMKNFYELARKYQTIQEND